MDEKFDPKCHIGEIHGIYTIIDMLDKKDKHGHWIYKSECSECGFIRFSHYGSISGKYKSTKCKHLRANGEYITYGCKWNNKRIDTIFRGMLSRCYDTNDKNYIWYGEKGIDVCEEWRENPKLFEIWAIDSGYDDNLTIDRIESNKDYCPENSRRAGRVNWIIVDNKKLTGRQWADYLGIGTNVINTAIRKYGTDKTKELIVAMLKESPSTKHRKSNQTWFSVYGIQT